jgi:hypothetical protein
MPSRLKSMDDDGYLAISRYFVLLMDRNIVMAIASGKVKE